MSNRTRVPGGGMPPPGQLAAMTAAEDSCRMIGGASVFVA
jgi:hypothetical protein